YYTFFAPLHFVSQRLPPVCTSLREWAPNRRSNRFGHGRLDAILLFLPGGSYGHIHQFAQTPPVGGLNDAKIPHTGFAIHDNDLIPMVVYWVAEAHVPAFQHRMWPFDIASEAVLSST